MTRLIREVVVKDRSVEGEEDGFFVSISAADLNKFDSIRAMLCGDGVAVTFYSVTKLEFVTCTNPVLDLVSLGSGQGFIDELQRLITKKIHVDDFREPEAD